MMILMNFFSINIFNINGQFVNKLVSEHGYPGTFSVRWDGRDALDQPVPTGMYIYQLISTEGILSKKMLLLK
mgnify:FL=1